MDFCAMFYALVVSGLLSLRVNIYDNDINNENTCILGMFHMKHLFAAIDIT